MKQRGIADKAIVQIKWNHKTKQNQKVGKRKPGGKRFEAKHKPGDENQLHAMQKERSNKKQKSIKWKRQQRKPAGQGRDKSVAVLGGVPFRGGLAWTLLGSAPIRKILFRN